MHENFPHHGKILKVCLSYLSAESGGGVIIDYGVHVTTYLGAMSFTYSGSDLVLHHDANLLSAGTLTMSGSQVLALGKSYWNSTLNTEVHTPIFVHSSENFAITSDASVSSCYAFFLVVEI